MIKKSFLPESFGFDVPSVELIGCGSKGLDKQAMVKRASAFDDVIAKVEKKPNRAYLHVITTGAFEKYGANCFVGDTLVTTEDGPVPIKDIKVGTKVLTKEGDYKPVTRKFMRGYTGPIYTLSTKEGRATMTANHPVFIVTNKKTKEGAFVDAETVKTGDNVLISTGKGKCSKVTIEGAQNSLKMIIVYNLEVADSHTYCVPFVVHNCNGDGWNGESFTLEFPHPENQHKTAKVLDGGLSKYHDDTYMKDGAVYQEHQTKSAGVDPSGEVVAARYNKDMQRGELLIAVDMKKWASRLQRKANGQNIYLSIGASVPMDTCVICGREAKTASQHCEHFTKYRGQMFDCGKVACVMNDSPSFYDISGVDVPADRIAFVLQKVASGEATAKTAALEAFATIGARPPMLLTKAARILGKLAEMEKKIHGMIEGDKKPDMDAFEDNDEAKKDFLLTVENYPSDEIIDGCNRHGILLSPGMLFKIMGKDCDHGESLMDCNDDCCGDMSCMMEELEEDDDRNTELLDGSFDQHLPVDLNLDSILKAFVPEFGTSDPVINAKVIRITISGKPEKKQEKTAALSKQAQEALRKTYARYLVSFAACNDEASCTNALLKIAAMSK